MLRVAHITDLHVERTPRAGELLNKRAVGAVNLYLLGRKAHFTEATIAGLVEALLREAPDLVVCTGDLTATATEDEFLAARELLAPVLERFPFLVLPGNHDVYTGESVGRFARHFGAWIQSEPSRAPCFRGDAFLAGPRRGFIGGLRRSS